MLRNVVGLGKDTVSSTCDPRYAPAGDVSAALLLMDSRLKSIYSGREGDPDDEQQMLVRNFVASLGPDGVDELVDGTCTIIYMLMTWLRETHEAHDKDVLEYVVPGFVEAMSRMPRSVAPEVIPTMVGMVVAAGIGLSPNLWRMQYGKWTEAEMAPLEVTVFLLAEQINRITDDRGFAVRVIADVLDLAEEQRKS